MAAAAATVATAVTVVIVVLLITGFLAVPREYTNYTCLIVWILRVATYSRKKREKKDECVDVGMDVCIYIKY